MTTDPHAPRHRIIVALVTLSIGLVAVPALAAASTVGPSATSLTQQWAYGAHWEGHRSGSSTVGASSGTFSANAVFGWEAILSQENTSATTYQVDVLWTAAAELWVTYCSPTCTSPTLLANLTDRAEEQVHAVTNYTTDSTVEENGQAVPALGISGATADLSANLSENSSIHGSALGTIAHAPTRSLMVRDVESGAVGFTPALGLFPTNLNAPANWSSASTYTGLGTWNTTWTYNAVSLTGHVLNLSSQFVGSLPASGPVWINGTWGGPVALAGVQGASVVNLEFGGPFTLLDGGILVPAAAELMHSGSSTSPPQQPWAGDRMGNQTVRLLNLDVRSGSLSHIGLMASAMTYTSTGTSPSVNAILETTPALSPTNQTGAATVQAEPQSVATAEAGTDCLEAGVDCGGGTSGLSPQLVQALVAIGAVVGVAALLSVLVVERRRIPPPARPTSSQYQPGVARSSDSPSGGRVTPGSSPPATEPADPLDHLW